MWVSFENGGSGIHAYSCQHVDIINNTVWNNSQTAETKWASLFASHRDNVHLLNNIAYMLMQDRPTNNNALNTNSVIYDYNIYFNGQAPVSMGKHDLIINPSFAKLVPKLGDINIANFSLGSNSPALNSGTTQIVPDVDITGLTRPIGYVDRGAYQGKTSLSISQWYAQALASYNTF